MTMTKCFFVTGTDTGVGKTFIASAILRETARHVKKRVGIKPVAAGCEWVDGELRNDDALELMAAAECTLPYNEINPVALEPAIAPHIALEQQAEKVSVAMLAEHCRKIAAHYDVCLIEGAGGWFVPLNQTETLADLCVALQAEVILVVGMRLGCLNHALLTAAAIKASGVRIAGWVANLPGESMPYLEQNIATLEAQLDAPCLGKVPFLNGGPIAAQAFIDIKPLTETPV